MNEPEPNPFELIRLYWRYLAPTWSMPVVLMILQVIEDITDNQDTTQWVGMFLIALLVLGSVSAVAFLRRRVQIPWVTFQAIWTFPTVAIWCGLVYLRAAVMTILGRPL